MTTTGQHTTRPASAAPPGDVPGMDLCPDPLTARTPAEPAHALRRYWAWAGQPSYRLMARRSGHAFAASTLHTALHGGTPPSLAKITAIITGCHGTTAHHQAFATAWRQLHLPPATTTRRPPVTTPAWQQPSHHDPKEHP